MRIPASAFRGEGSVGKYSTSETFWWLEKWMILFEEKTAQMFLFTKPVTHKDTEGRGICLCHQLEHM